MHRHDIPESARDVQVNAVVRAERSGPGMAHETKRALRVAGSIFED